MKPLNIWSRSDEEIGRQMSNFTHTPFVMGGLEFASFEAFYVWLLLSGKNDHERMEKVRNMWGIHAKRMAPNQKPHQICYEGTWMALGGSEHLELCKKALRAKLKAHPDIALEFAKTKPRPLIHDTGHPDQPDAEFPAYVFCQILTELREEFVAENLD